MASNLEYLTFVLDQLDLLKDISFKAMMGEFLLYCDNKLFGGIYDDRLLVKQTKSARELLPDAPLQKPYPGAKEMILVENFEDTELLAKLVESIVNDLNDKKTK